MKSIKLILAFSFIAGLYACQSDNTVQEEQEMEQVDSLSKNDNERADSMKRALGL